MGSFRVAGPRRKVKGALAPFQWLNGANWFGPRRDTPSRPPLGIINVIFATLGRTGSSPSRVMSMARLPAKDSSSGLKRAKMNIQPVLGFSYEDKIGTIQTP